MNNSIKLMPDEAPAAGAVAAVAEVEESHVPQTGVDTTHEKGLEGDGGKTPTVVADEEKVVSFESFKEGKVEEVVKKEEKKDEKDKVIGDEKLSVVDKQDNKEQEQGKAIEGKLPVPPDKQQHKEFSYEGFSEAQVRLLKNASREAREYFAAQIKENNDRATKLKELGTQFEEYKKTGNAGLPQSYLEHQDAYVLSKDFQKEVDTVQKASNDLAYWERQLINIKKAEKWTDYVKQGDKWIPVEREPSPEAEMYVGNRLKNAEGLLGQAQERANALKTSHIQQYRQNIEIVKKIEDEQFPQFKDEEKCEGKEHIKYMKGVWDQLGQGSNIMLGSFCKMYASMRQIAPYIKQLEEENKKLKGGQVIKREVGPTSDDINGADRLAKPANKDDEIVKFDMFSKDAAV